MITWPPGVTPAAEPSPLRRWGCREPTAGRRNSSLFWTGSPPGSAGPDPRRRARLFVHGLLSDIRRKNGWTLAEYAGDHDPNGMQRLLNAARWDVDGVRDDLRQWVMEHLGDRPRGVLVAHESAFAKKG